MDPLRPGVFDPLFVTAVYPVTYGTHCWYFSADFHVI